MGRIIVLFISLFFFKTMYTQKTIRGIIANKNEERIPFAIIEVIDLAKDTSIYLSSDENGLFTIKNTTANTLEIRISALGFSPQKKLLDFQKIDTKKQLKFILKEKRIKLKEVIIRTKKPLILKKDTIKFRTKYFTNGTEQTVEELLKKIPGLRIDSEGTIKVGNREIEKLMIEGDDFFEKGYKVLSKNMPAHPIEEVEILKNFSNNRLLKGIENSDKIALNLKLNDKSKRIWFGNINSDYGLFSENIYQLKFNLMNFGKKNKYYFLANFNNIGTDAVGDIKSLINPTRYNEPSSIGDNQSVNNLLNLSTTTPYLKKRRSNFNNVELASLNAIFNPTKKIKIKTLGFLNWDETDFSRKKTDVVNTNNISFTNNQNYELRNKKRIFFGKIDLTYNISKTKMLRTTTKYSTGKFNDSSNLLFNTISTLENLESQRSLFDQKINYTNKFKDKKVFLLTGRFINEKTPQNYTVNRFLYHDLFPSFMAVNNVSQESVNQMQFAGINAHLLDRKENGNLLEFQLGNEFRKDKLSTSFTLLENDKILNTPNDYQNKTNYLVNNLYLKNKFQLKINDFDFIGKLNIHQLFNRLENNSIFENQTPFFINPSLGLDWKINNKNIITSSYSFNTKNAKILDVFSDFVLTGFRSFSKGTGSFNQLNASNFTFNHQLGNWSDRFFVNTFIFYNKNHDFFSTNTTLNQNFSLGEKILIKNQKSLNINSNINYFFKSISSNLKLDVGYTKSDFKNSINNGNLRKVVSSNYNLGLELRSSFKGVINYHIGTKWTSTEIKTTTNNSFIDNISFLDLSFIFNDKLDMHFQSEHYHFGNLETNNNYLLLDFDANYKLIKNKLTFGITGKNLFNSKKFKNFSVSDIGTSTTEYKLLSRFILLKMEYRF